MAQFGLREAPVREPRPRAPWRRRVSDELCGAARVEGRWVFSCSALSVPPCGSLSHEGGTSRRPQGQFWTGGPPPLSAVCLDQAWRRRTSASSSSGRGGMGPAAWACPGRPGKLGPRTVWARFLPCAPRIVFLVDSGRREHPGWAAREDSLWAVDRCSGTLRGLSGPGGGLSPVHPPSVCIGSDARGTGADWGVRDRSARRRPRRSAGHRG